MNGRKSVKGCSVWVFPSRLDTKVLAKWFDVKIFNPFCTVWDAFVTQDESDWVSCSSDLHREYCIAQHKELTSYR